MKKDDQPVPASSHANDQVGKPSSTKRERVITNLKLLLLLTGIYSLIFNQARKNKSTETASILIGPGDEIQGLNESGYTGRLRNMTFIVNKD